MVEREERLAIVDADPATSVRVGSFACLAFCFCFFSCLAVCLRSILAFLVLARAKQTSLLWVDASQKLHYSGGRDDEGGSLGLLDIMAD